MKNEKRQKKIKNDPAAAGYHNFSFFIFHFSLRRGFSLIEAVVYVALLGVVAVFVANSLVYLVTTYARARAEREVLSNARSITATLSSHIASAAAPYRPTSRFDADAGQLSLITSATSTPGHTMTYADVWSDNGIVYLREEGVGDRALSAGSVRVTILKFERVAQALGREAVRVTLRVDATGARFPASATLITTTALRGNY